MILDKIQEDLEKLFEPFCKDLGILLVELKVYRRGRDVAIEILADKPSGGITIDACSQLNRNLNEAIETQCLIADNYTLEVSSPGLDRPLKTFLDFQRVVGRKVHLFLSEPVDSRVEYSGVILRVENDNLVITQGEDQVLIPMGSINKGKQIIAPV